MAQDDNESFRQLTHFMPEHSTRFENSKNANAREIAIRVAGLLAHYWTGNDDRATRRAQILDWVSDLQEFPLGAIEIAIITWRRNNRTRPTPADIRKLILPDPEPLIEGGAAYLPGRKSKLSLHQLAKHRQALGPLWDLVRRAQAGEDPELLIAERKRLTAEMFARDPELERISTIIEEEEDSRRRDFSEHFGT